MRIKCCWAGISCMALALPAMIMSLSGCALHRVHAVQPDQNFKSQFPSVHGSEQSVADILDLVVRSENLVVSDLTSRKNAGEEVTPYVNAEGDGIKLRVEIPREPNLKTQRDVVIAANELVPDLPYLDLTDRRWVRYDHYDEASGVHRLVVTRSDGWDLVNWLIIPIPPFPRRVLDFQDDLRNVARVLRETDEREFQIQNRISTTEFGGLWDQRGNELKAADEQAKTYFPNRDPEPPKTSKVGDAIGVVKGKHSTSTAPSKGSTP